jgi:hypothetical protein
MAAVLASREDSNDDMPLWFAVPILAFCAIAVIFMAVMVVLDIRESRRWKREQREWRR